MEWQSAVHLMTDIRVKPHISRRLWSSVDCISGRVEDAEMLSLEFGCLSNMEMSVLFFLSRRLVNFNWLTPSGFGTKCKMNGCTY